MYFLGKHIQPQERIPYEKFVGVPHPPAQGCKITNFGPLEVLTPQFLATKKREIKQKLHACPDQIFECCSILFKRVVNAKR